jgi:hypothetical protein
MASLQVRVLRSAASVRRLALPSSSRFGGATASISVGAPSSRKHTSEKWGADAGTDRLFASASARAFGRRTLSTLSLPPELQPFRELGYVDEDGLTVFDTLHEMQVRSCQVFSNRQLFGTYSDDSKKFEWMTFKEYAEKVDSCRAFLQSVGKSRGDLLFAAPFP